MTFNTEIPVGELSLVPIGFMLEQERLDLGSDLYRAVSNNDTFEWLLERHLDGVVDRHSVSDRSHATVDRAYDNHLNTNDDYYGILANGEAWIGMGTVLHSLPLRAPHAVTGLLPARITRWSDYLSKSIKTHGPNVTAWVSMEHGGHLSDIYGKLGELASKGAWTIEPVRSVQGRAAIRAAGFTALGKARHYDDIETGYTPPLAQYFERQI